MSSDRKRSRRQGRIRRRLAPRLHPELLGDEVRDFLGRLDRTLEDLAGGEGAPPGFEPQHLIHPEFSRIRPFLVYCAARTVMVDTKDNSHLVQDDETEHVAMAAELLHLAVLLHDAALGRQGGRRRRAARRIIGGAMDMLGANHLTLRALELARLSPKPEIIGDLLEAMREITESHVLAQRQAEDFPAPHQTLTIAEGRNGSIFSFSCRSGARLGGGSRQQINALGRYGRHTGIAWHMAEDMAIVDASERELAEILAERAQNNHVGYIVSLAVEQNPSLLAAWKSLGQSGDSEEALVFAEAVKNTGAVQRGRQRLVNETWAAQRALQALPDNTHRAQLHRIVHDLAN